MGPASHTFRALRPLLTAHTLCNFVIPMPTSKLHAPACAWLIAATAVWGLSFPLLKVLHLRHAGVDSPWVISCWTLVTRCALAALVLAIFQPQALRRITRAEAWQALGLVLTGGPGLLLQADGLASTEASTSAFLTQFYCVLLPLIAAVRSRAWPPARTLVCTTLVLVGMGILAKLSWGDLRLGPGEWKTLLAATIFTGQILLLEVPAFSANRSSTITVLSLAGTALLALAFAAPATVDGAGLLGRWMQPAELGIHLIIGLGCTLFSYLMMNHWQKHVTATEAGLIYCLEPVFTALLVLFLPVWLGNYAHIDYPNESLTWSLVVGGGLVTLANVVRQLRR